MEHAFDLVRPADDRIERPLAGQLRQIAAEFIERGRVALLVLFSGGAAL